MYGFKTNKYISDKSIKSQKSKSRKVPAGKGTSDVHRLSPLEVIVFTSGGFSVSGYEIFYQ